MRDCLIVDMDGTLTDVSSIRHWITAYEASGRKSQRNFDRFHEDSVHCPPHFDVLAQVRVAYLLGVDIVIVTARKEKWRNHTAFWLAWNHVPSHALFMRGNKDQRPDVEVKRDILSVIRRSWNPIGAIDDNPSVIAMWQDEGIPVTIKEGWDE
mgnify:CR=1 FL=1